MNTPETHTITIEPNPIATRVEHPAEQIAISATELAKMIQAGQGTDVNDLVNRMLHERKAA